MRLRIDTTMVQFFCAKASEIRLEFNSTTPKLDPTTGLALYSTQLVAVDETGGEVINVITAGDPKVTMGQSITLTGLTATPWSQGERSGISYRAENITSQRGSESKNHS